jgi:hypothetical protein
MIAFVIGIRMVCFAHCGGAGAKEGDEKAWF